MKRVLIVHNYYKIPGGEDTVVANEKAMLEEKGHKVILYSRNNSEYDHMRFWQKMMVPLNTIFNVESYRAVRKLIRDNEIDIVHIHNTLNVISPSVYYAGLKEKIPVIQTIHNFRLLCPGATFYRNNSICEDCLTKGLLCAVQNKCYRNSRIQTLACVLSMTVHRLLKVYEKINYICLTDFNRDKLLLHGQIQKKRIFVKPNFVKNNTKIHYNRKHQIVYAGRLDELKGIKLLFSAWKILEKERLTLPPKLIVCGSGPLEDWCNDFIRSNELESIVMNGYVENQKVRSIVGESLALILPTQWYEGFPMSIVEAFSQGTPVLGSDIGNVGDLIDDGVNGYKFTHDSPEKICDAVINLINSELMYTSTLHTYCDRYTEDINYDILSEIYEEVSR